MTSALQAEESLWKVKDVARFINVSPDWVYDRVNENAIPFRRLHGTLRFDPDTIRDWARNSAHNNAPAAVLALRSRNK